MQRLTLILTWSDAISLCKEAMMSDLSWMIFSFSTITSSFAFNSLDFLSKWDSSITNKEKCIRKQRQHIHHTTNPHLDVKKENFQYRKQKVLILSKYVVCHIFNRPRKTRLVFTIHIKLWLGLLSRYHCFYYSAEYDPSQSLGSCTTVPLWSVWCRESR